MPTSPASKAQATDANTTMPDKVGSTVPFLTVGRDAEPVYIHHIERAYIGFDRLRIDSDTVPQESAEDTTKFHPDGCTPVSAFNAALFENTTREIRDLVKDTRTAANDMSTIVRALQAEQITFRILIESLLRDRHSVFSLPSPKASRSHSPSDTCEKAFDADVSNLTEDNTNARDAASNGSIISHLTSDFYSDPEDEHTSWNPFTLPSPRGSFYQSTSV
ncbi:hypothetical protein CVT24_006696 [Panaeolus cyanescens]|uniref:Uncharacterized protein n=1 Tax=Panaeolus cyanescens TaxID=181874 RepID=A0A409WC24_9AGAR|nr:hypothetical protein CVT24_006696 [Panaeolus cyanescens]